LLSRRVFRAAGFAAAFTIVAYSVSLVVAFNGHAESVPVLSEPTITATASPDSGRPGDLVTISFASSDSDWRIDSCEVRFAGSSSSCAAKARSVDLRVPDTAAPGTTSINWTANYHYEPLLKATGNEPCCGGNEGGGGTSGGLSVATGSITFTVLPPSGQVSPSASPPGGGANGSVNPPGGKVGSPSTGDERQSPGQSSGDTGPPVAQPNTVPRSGSSPLLIGIPLIVVLLVVAAIAVTLIARRVRARSALRIRGRSKQPPADPRVRAVAHPDPYVQVMTQEAQKGRTHVVRLERHSGIPDVYVQEVRK
jgi:hypothetical protein